MSDYREVLAAAGVPSTAESILAFGSVWEQLEPSIKVFAKRLTTNSEDRKDLVQEAMITLWAQDPARWDFRNARDVSYVRRILHNRMCDVWGEDHRDAEEKADTVAAGSDLAAQFLAS
jgi:DNA-directed RNA polymerase specialized sigma24 family protein